MLRQLLSAVALGLLALPGLAQETRTFVDDTGTEVTVPASPQRIVSLRGEQFTAPLIEMGAPIVGSSGRARAGMNNGEPFPRGAFDRFGTTFDDDLVWIGGPNDPDLETIAALEPDLILIPDWQTDLRPQLSQIAPTVVINIWSNPMLERYRKIAEAVGQTEAYEAGLALYNLKLEQARLVLADRIDDPSTVSVAIAEAHDGNLNVARDYAALSQVLRDLGFAMPKIIANLEEGNANISVELLPEINADFLIGTYAMGVGQTPSQRIEEWDNLMPAWDSILHAPQHNQHIIINREAMRALSFRSLEAMLELMLSHVVERDFVPLDD